MADLTAAAAPTDYDAVAYPSYSHSIAHPDGFAVLSRLFGLPTADIAACRVLELGCGDGAQIIPLAEANPRSTFLGVDLSARAIARGRADIAALGLDNVRLEVADVVAWRPEPGAFDYVIAHGLYAWVPPEAQEGALAIAGVALREGGLAMVSYNVAPGNNLRLILRELLQTELAGVVGFEARAERAQAELRLALEDIRRSHPLGVALHAEATHWLDEPPSFLLHDILAPCYAPARLPDLVSHAARHGLSYFGDANGQHIRREAFPNESDERILAASDGDLVAAEHRHDLRTGRVFRHTLLRKGPPGFRRTLDLDVLPGLHASLSPRLGEREALGEETDGQWTMAFGTNEGLVARIGGPPARHFLEALAAVFPGSAPVAELGMVDEGRRIVAMLFASGAIRLWSRPLPMAAAPGPRPAAMGFTRLQAAAGRPSVTRLDHDMVKIDAMGARLVSLLDGTRTLPDLADRLAAQTGMDPAALRAALPQNLQGLCKMGLVRAD